MTETSAENISAGIDEEEFWPAPPSLLTTPKIHTIRFGRGNGVTNGSVVLRYRSLPSEELTPLDMVYTSTNIRNNEGNDKDKDNDSFRDDEFYDGTGNLMWLAAVCFGHLVVQEVEPLRSYLFEGSPTPTVGRIPEARRRFCELGCGTGGAGISLLLCSPVSSNKHNHRETENSTENASCHLVFTDNDAQSLELCESNCELNLIDPKAYSQALLGWGSEHLETAQTFHPEGTLQPHSFDVVLATDVIYDLKMIAPLFETIDGLLKKKQPRGERDHTRETTDHRHNGGHLVLSHVPRFCIPKDKPADGGYSSGCGMDREENPHTGDAFFELEKLIHTEARKVGLVLVETIRPHRVLSEEGIGVPGSSDEHDDDDDDGGSMQKLTLEAMEEAHAVVFVFGRL
mmetsp:Transcript_42364/g.83224  ORF Transcript_42364/g.83224 Transcript_42364/m.83224 type:complete len:400 (+) Transcript_42364:142-1341(+)